MTSIRFPNESTEYRAARDALLVAERELRTQVEMVAALRRTLPLGGEVPQDYAFDEGQPGKRVKLSQLFGPGHDTLILYSFMFGPASKKPCPMCTSFLDSLDGAAPHLAQRIGLGVVARSPIKRIRDFAATRGWRHLRLLSSSDNTYHQDYHGENEAGEQLPMLNVFARRGGTIHHFYGTELLFMPHEPGQDSRHIDPMWPLWNVMDLTPDGRGSDWYPELDYRGAERLVRSRGKRA